MTDTLTATEQTKYEQMWGFDQYRKTSPGLNAVPTFLDLIGRDPGSRLIDFGCGTGRASLKLLEEGFLVTGVDIAMNCLDPEPARRIQFIHANLWELDNLGMLAEYGYCCDVMEHIPPEKVNDVLAGIAATVTDSCFFRIALGPDNMGRLIDETLHLTVRPAYWWRDLLIEHFDHVQEYPRTGTGHVDFVCVT